MLLPFSWSVGLLVILVYSSTAIATVIGDHDTCGVCSKALKTIGEPVLLTFCRHQSPAVPAHRKCLPNGCREEGICYFKQNIKIQVAIAYDNREKHTFTVYVPPAASADDIRAAAQTFIENPKNEPIYWYSMRNGVQIWSEDEDGETYRRPTVKAGLIPYANVLKQKETNVRFVIGSDRYARCQKCKRGILDTDESLNRSCRYYQFHKACLVGWTEAYGDRCPDEVDFLADVEMFVNGQLGFQIQTYFGAVATVQEMHHTIATAFVQADTQSYRHADDYRYAIGYELEAVKGNGSQVLSPASLPMIDAYASRKPPLFRLRAEKFHSKRSKHVTVYITDENDVDQYECAGKFQTVASDGDALRNVAERCRSSYTIAGIDPPEYEDIVDVMDVRHRLVRHLVQDPIKNIGDVKTIEVLRFKIRPAADGSPNVTQPLDINTLKDIERQISEASLLHSRKSSVTSATPAKKPQTNSLLDVQMSSPPKSRRPSSTVPSPQRRSSSVMPVDPTRPAIRAVEERTPIAEKWSPLPKISQKSSRKAPERPHTTVGRKTTVSSTPRELLAGSTRRTDTSERPTEHSGHESRWRSTVTSQRPTVLRYRDEPPVPADRKPNSVKNSENMSLTSDRQPKRKSSDDLERSVSRTQRPNTLEFARPASRYRSSEQAPSDSMAYYDRNYDGTAYDDHRRDGDRSHKRHKSHDQRYEARPARGRHSSSFAYRTSDRDRRPSSRQSVVPRRRESRLEHGTGSNTEKLGEKQRK